MEINNMVLTWLLHSVSYIFPSSKTDNIEKLSNSNKISFSSKGNDHEYYYYSKGGAEKVHDHDHHHLAAKFTSATDCKHVEQGKCGTNYFQMPLHYPRYKKADYEKMEEWKVDMLLQEYGLNFKGTLEEKRSFAIGAFLWPDQL